MIDTDDSKSDLLFLAEVWPFADKYFADEFKKYFITMFEDIANAIRKSSITHDCMNYEFKATLRYAYANPNDELSVVSGLQLVLVKILADINARRRFATDALYVGFDGQPKHTSGRFKNWIRDIPCYRPQHTTV